MTLQDGAYGPPVASELVGKLVDAGTLAVALYNLLNFIVCQVFLLLAYLDDDTIRIVGKVSELSADLREWVEISGIKELGSEDHEPRYKVRIVTQQSQYIEKRRP